MLALRWPAAAAGSVGLAVALGLAWFGPAADQSLFLRAGPAAATAGALAEALFTAATILWIVFPALCIQHLQAATGAVETIRSSMARLSDDPRIAALLIGWFFALFIEGAAGFGTPIALAAPLLVSVGYKPADAVTIALVGHSVGVSFGAVGTPVLPLSAATGIDGREIAGAIGAYHGLAGGIMTLVVVWLARAARTERSGGAWGWAALAALAFLVPFYVLARWVGPELPTLGGALCGGLLFVVLLNRFRRSSTRPEAQPRAALLRAAAPYLILVALVLVTRLAGPIRIPLQKIAWEWTLLGEFSGRIAPLYQPGTMLMVAFLAGAFSQGASAREVASAMRRAGLQLGLVSVALVAMLALSRVMVHGGMIHALALSASGVGAGAWPLIAPSIGVLGTFITGSATASNILFTDFQQVTARALDLPVLALVAAQGFGAAVGNIICPHNIIAGGATVGLAGDEGAVLRRTLWVCAVYALVGGLLALAFAAWAIDPSK